MIIFIVIWLFILLATINEIYKGNYVCITLFVIFNIVIVYVVIKSNLKDNKKINNNKHKDISEKNEKTKKENDIEIQEFIFFDMINKK